MMGDQTSFANHQSKVYWNPIMERYFIDLMLEHLQKGNKIGYTFNDEAWTDMLTRFNARFGSQCGKHVLISHYANLWEQVNDVQKLLHQHFGFNWDAIRQMVVADDFVWDLYLKADPGARCYRTKPLLNFDRLSVIFGYLVDDGRFNLSSHNVCIDAEVDGPNLGVMMMSNQTASTNDRTRMYWTPMMERYFIDLMLEHLHKGNRIGHTLSKQAWTEMITMFNAKFGSQYDKDVLRSRYTIWFKQFNDVKSLLRYPGFTWDASRQMVAAEDFVWDAYLKIHPDAKCYKTKSLKHFDDLCVIYGYAVADGRYSLSSHDVIDDDVHGLSSGDGMGSVGVSNKEHSKTDWNASMDHYLIELLIDQLGRGNKVNKDFNKKAWTDMLDMFNAKFGTRHFKRVLKNRFRKLSKYYCEMREFLKRGFSWNEQKQMLSADDDVWDAYIKAHPHARTYRLKTLPNYRDLELIFKDMADDEISNLHQEKNNNDVTSEIKAGEGKGKGRRDSSGTDRTRTYWTPPMDRFLIDLLLEHVKSGNKLGQTFFTQAWNDMVTSFNEQFKSQYDKDVLKNRYKNLRKQFSDVDNVLCQSGFSWDDTREMVAAEDHVWDAYIKAHPEARSLRVKTLPGYHKLRVIFGVERSDTRYIRLSHYAQPLMIGEQNNGSLPSVRGSASKAEWPESLQCLFVDLMIEQVNSGNQNGYIFNEQAWTHMTEAFSARLGLQCDKQFLLDQYFCLMKQHDDIINILHHSGFAWDETVSRIIADYDTWDAYIKDIPSAASYKNRSLYLYRDLCKIFGNKVSDIRASDLEHLLEMSDFTFEMDLDGTSGDFFGNTDSVRDPDGPRGMDMDGNLVVDGNTEISYQNKERPNEIGVVGTSGKSDVISNDEVSNQYSERPRESGKDGTFANMVVTGDAQVLSRDKIRPNQMDMAGTCGTLATSGNTNVSDVVKKRPSTTPLDSRPSKKDMRMEEALSEMASAVKALMDKDEKNCNALLENDISALQAIPDIDDELVIDACDLLEDERMTKIFLALDTSLRKKWLLRKLRK